MSLRLRSLKESYPLRVVVLTIFLVLLIVYVPPLISHVSGSFYLNNPLFYLLFSINIIVLLIVFVLLVKNLFLTLIPKSGTKLRIRLFTAFALLILGPALFTVFLASSFVERGINRLTRIQFRRVVDSALTLGKCSVQETALAHLKDKKVCKLEGTTILCPDGNYSLSGAFEDKVDSSAVFFTKNRLFVCRGNRCSEVKVNGEFSKTFWKMQNLKSSYFSFLRLKSSIKGLYIIIFSLSGLAILAGAFWFARYFEKTINTPLEKLHGATQRVASGDLDVRVQETGVDELSQVIKAFNKMVEDLKSLKGRIERERDFVESVLNSISPAVLTFDSAGNLKVMNESAKRLFPKVGKLNELLSKYPNLKRAVAKIWDEGGKSQVKEIMDTGQRELKVEVVPSATSRILIIEDITEIVSAQKDRAFKEIVRRLAHEVKNPLTPIVLNAERIRKNVENPSLKRAASVITEQAETIRRLIDEFRLYARLPMPKREKVNLHELFKELSLAFEEKLKISTNCPRQLVITADKDLLRSVFLNLLKNSIEAGAKNVNVDVIRQKGKVLISLSDDGSGVPEEISDKLFSPYASTKEGERGLGLSIVRRIIEEHGGKIKLAGKNTFIIELPA